MDVPQAEAVVGSEEARAVTEYMSKGRWLTEFEETERLEERIADVTDSEYALVVSNGTVSLMIALMALGVEDGDEVLVPDYTFVASAYAVSMLGADPVLVDVDPETLCMDPAEAEAAITDQTEVLMHVSMNGRSGPMDEFVELTEEYDLRLLEDAAQALGSTHDGRQLGTFGDVGSYSFSYSKIVTTGQGGALVTDDADLYDEMSRIKDFGRPQAGVDEHTRLGFNAKFTDLQAVVGLEQLQKLDARVRRKGEIYDRYFDHLADVTGVEFVSTDTSETAPYGIDVLLEPDVRRDLQAFLDEEGIGTRTFYPPVHTQEPYAETSAECPNSAAISSRGLWLPSSVALSDGQVDEISETIVRFFDSR